MGAAPNWRLMFPQSKERLYHSVAALLPDGRVVSAGGRGGGSEYSVELYRPPYFFKSARPSIESLPSGSWKYSDGAKTLTVTLHGSTAPDADVKRVALLTPTSASHTAHFDQRYIQLSIDVVSISTDVPPIAMVDINLPNSSSIAPQGYYLLTVVDDHDVPSIASIIHLVD